MHAASAALAESWMNSGLWSEWRSKRSPRPRCCSKGRPCWFTQPVATPERAPYIAVFVIFRDPCDTITCDTVTRHRKRYTPR